LWTRTTRRVHDSMDTCQFWRAWVPQRKRGSSGLPKLKRRCHKKKKSFTARREKKLGHWETTISKKKKQRRDQCWKLETRQEKPASLRARRRCRNEPTSSPTRRTCWNKRGGKEPDSRDPDLVRAGSRRQEESKGQYYNSEP